MIENNDFVQIVKTINERLPLHSMWDGFWVHLFKRKTLVIACSFDSIYYRDFDIIFKKVIFFNVPEKWSDIDILTDELIRISTQEEFKQYHPDFDTQGQHIFAIDIMIRHINLLKPITFFIIAEHIYLNKCEYPENNPVPEYEDPFTDEMFPCMKNRVIRKEEE